jgi:hypothetical protein
VGNHDCTFSKWQPFLCRIYVCKRFETLLERIFSLKTYEYSVKQSIGFGNILPWSRLWIMDSPFKRTPQGGLILHWIGSVILISVTSRISSISESISFPGSVQSYAQGVVGCTTFNPDLYPDFILTSSSFYWSRISTSLVR